MALTAVGLVVLVVFLILFCRAVVKEPARLSPSPDPVGRGAPRRVLRGEVIFAYRTAGRLLSLDCVVDLGSGGAKVPVHLRVSAPRLHVVGATLDEVVIRWLAQDHRVFIEARTGKGPRGRGRLTLRTDGGLVALDVEDDSDVKRYLPGARQHGHVA